MDRRDVVVIGGSAGGVEALLDLLPRLSGDFPASVFVVIHVAARAVSALPAILDDAAQLPVTQARDREAFRPGHVYVAPPDFHLAIGGGETRVFTGPREHRSRPAIDPLFRSAARGYGARVVGVVLSGANGDGTQGLSIVKQVGGLAVAQDPRTAPHARMPESAATQVEMDFVGGPAEIAVFLETAVREPLYPRPPLDEPTSEELTDDRLDLLEEEPLDDPSPEPSNDRSPEPDDPSPEPRRPGNGG